jgi:hypothetical protein
MSSSIPVPKFGSFKPNVTAEEVKKSSSVRSEHREKDRRHHRRRHRSRSRERTGREINVAPSVPAPKPDEPAEVFIEDWRGDAQNLIYGSIHRYSVPPFHRIGAGSVLGALKNTRIDRTFADDKAIVLSDRRDEAKAQREKYVFARNEKKAERLLRIRPDENTSAVDNLDFIALQISKPRKRARLSSHSSHSSQEDEHHYRSIEGKAKTSKEILDNDLEWATESDSSDPQSGRTIKFDEALRKRNIELSRRVDEHPREVDAWVALIEHQDNLLGWADGGHRKVTAAEKRSTADIKIHLYEKALAKANPSLQDRERLLVGMMTDGAKVWDFKTQSERWEQISQDNLDSVLLWKQYLDFRQSSFVTFRYEEVKDIYIKRIKLLKDTIKGAKTSDTENLMLYEHLIYTVLRATLFIREAGYSELALAIWQALFELNLFNPPEPTSHNTRLLQFQEFWDSEVLRIGEEGALGWRNFNIDVEAPEGKTDEDISSGHLNRDGIFDGWAYSEQAKATASREPARTMDDTTENDPYRLIMWLDIESFIFDLCSCSAPRRMSQLLLDGFLVFCRLPPMPTSDHLPSREWWTDSFARGELLDCTKSWIRDHFARKAASDRQIHEDSDIAEDTNPLDWPLPYFAGSADTLFPSNYLAKYFVPWRNPYARKFLYPQDIVCS